jgi:exodeoxyribonuclease V gamma subunit
LPLPVKTSYAWAEAVHSHGDPERAAGFRWRSNNYPGEEADKAYERAFGKGTWLSNLVERGLDTYACRLWLPMLRALE